VETVDPQLRSIVKICAKGSAHCDLEMAPTLALHDHADRIKIEMRTHNARMKSRMHTCIHTCNIQGTQHNKAKQRKQSFAKENEVHNVAI
jgi:tRNA G26 N,N-dimethylase Trm1